MPFLDNNVSLVPSECIKMEATATQGQPLTFSYVFFVEQLHDTFLVRKSSFKTISIITQFSYHIIMWLFL